MSKQVGLHNHSDMSALDGYSYPEAMAERTAELGQWAVAITDHGECSGHYSFQKACERHDVHPVLGMEGYWTPDIPLAKTFGKFGAAPISHLCLLARNQEGLRNLWAWSSIAYDKEHHWYKPLADPALMRTYAEGLWASDGCMLTTLGTAVEKGDEDAVLQYYGQLADVFGDHLYVELHTWQFMELNHELAAQAEGHGEHKKDEVCRACAARERVRLNKLMRDLNQVKLRMADQMGLPFVVVNDAHHTKAEQWAHRELMIKFNTRGKGLDALGEMGQKADHMMGDDELYHWMEQHGISSQDVARAIDNSTMIAQDCNARVEKTMDMPRLMASDTEDVDLLLSTVEQGWQRKVVDRGLDPDTYMARLDTELKLIVDKGFSGYFNVVADYVKAAKTGSYVQYIKPGARPDPMLCGPGRGSAGGSLVAYLCDITELDPIHYGLLFERFLTPEREGWPDIDVDFPKSKRDGVKEYVRRRHGIDHTCTIGTRVRFGPLAVLRDVCRVEKIDFKTWREIAEVLERAIAEIAYSTDDDDENQEDISWPELAKRKSAALKPYIDRFPQVFEKLNEITGRVKTYATHAAGIVMNNAQLLGAVPMRVKNDVLSTQFDMYEVEELGAVKMDLLALRHLDTIMECRRLIYERHGVWIDFDRTGYGIPEGAQVIDFTYEHYSDPAIWEPIDRGDTLGIFQLATVGGTDAAVGVRPRNEVDVSDAVSVNRPGVINAGLLGTYLKRRSGEEEVTFQHPLMERITGPKARTNTYGVLVYQEQLMEACRVLAGFSATEADNVRKIVGKKLMDKMVALQPEFVNGCLTNPDFMAPWGEDPTDEDFAKAQEIAWDIWKSLLASGAYAFNKCVVSSTQVRLSASSQYSNGTMSVGDMWRRLHDLAPVGSRHAPTYKVGDPCRYCGKPAVAKGRGQCRACLSWRNKFTTKGLQAWSLGEDGRLHPNRIINVHHNGTAPTWRVALEDGREITATANHRHMTPDGWREVIDLSIGDQLLVCGEYEQHVYEPREYKFNVPGGEGGWAAIKAWERTQELVCSEVGCGRSRAAGDRIERAHLDGDRTNNDPSNLAMKCVSHHKAYDYRNNHRRKRGEKGYPAVPVRIIAIEDAEEQEVFDLEMANPHHSWVGNGVVTHNSHGIGYSLISCWEAWLRYYYWAEFTCACLRTDKAENVNGYIRDARRRDTRILPPDVNASEGGFTLQGDAIRYGLQAVRGVGEAAVKDIMAKRQFTDLDDYMVRCTRGANKSALLPLIKVGAFDAFGERAGMLDAFYRWRIIDEAPQKVLKGGEDAVEEHIAALYAAKPDTYTFYDFSDEMTVYRLEQELVGTYVTVDPMHKYQDRLEECLSHPHKIEEAAKGEQLLIGGQLSRVATTTDRNGNSMAFLTVLHNEEEFHLPCFAEAWDRCQTLLSEGAPVLIKASRLKRGAHVTSVERLDYVSQR